MPIKNPETDKAVSDLLNPESDFFTAIEAHVEKENISYQEAILDWCQKRGVEIDAAAAAVRSNKKFKEKVFAESKRLHMVK